MPVTDNLGAAQSRHITRTEAHPPRITHPPKIKLRPCVPTAGAGATRMAMPVRCALRPHATRRAKAGRGRPEASSYALATGPCGECAEGNPLVSGKRTSRPGPVANRGMARESDAVRTL